MPKLFCYYTLFCYFVILFFKNDNKCEWLESKTNVNKGKWTLLQSIRSTWREKLPESYLSFFFHHFSTTFWNAITAFSKMLGLILCVWGCVLRSMNTNSFKPVMTQRIFGFRGNLKPREGCAGQDMRRIREDTSAGNEKVSGVNIEHWGFLSLNCNLFFFDWYRMKKRPWTEWPPPWPALFYFC